MSRKLLLDTVALVLALVAIFVWMWIACPDGNLPGYLIHGGKP